MLETLHPEVTLGTAMAISGAAAAPNMGTTTVRALVFVLTLLNVRLGYWLPNPRAVVGAGWYRRFVFRRGAGPGYLWREALGAVTDARAFVNVSDGGHVENFALYELLRRRCKLIVAVDGEADPEMRFGGLLTLVRYAHIDLGVEIDIDLAPIRIDEHGLSERHFALGTIRYGDDPEANGHLLYLKLSVTGDEADSMLEYRARHPDFPHQPTSDQFFDEAQFEAYRSLGYHVGEGALSESSMDYAALVDLR